MIRDLIQRNDWMVTIDLKDAYLSVPVAQEHRQFLRFAWGDNLFEFQCLPFGLSSAPRVFTKLLRPVMAILRQKGIRCIVFLDDLLIMAQSREELEKQLPEILLLLQLLGFRINWDKSRLSPTQQIEYLGLLIDSLSLTLSLPEEKVRGIVKSCSWIINQGRISV